MLGGMIGPQQDDDAEVLVVLLAHHRGDEHPADCRAIGCTRGLNPRKDHTHEDVYLRQSATNVTDEQPREGDHALNQAAAGEKLRRQ